METNNTTPQGKGMAVTGFVLALVGLIFSSWGVGLSLVVGMWLGYFWIALCIASIVLSVMGMSKLGKTGGKKGLGIAGMIIGIVAVIWSIVVLLGVLAMNKIKDSAMEGFNSAEFKDAMKDLGEQMKDSLKVE